MVTCPRCRATNVRNAAVIVGEQTTTSTVTAYGMADGKPVSYPLTRTSQTILAQNLTADEPRKGINWFTVICLLTIMPPLLVLSFAFCAGLEASNGNSINIPSLILLVACVAAIIVVSIIMSVVSKTRTKRFNQKHNDWWNLLQRRYHCDNCHNIFQL